MANWGVSPPEPRKKLRSSAGHAQAAPRLCRLDFAWSESQTFSEMTLIMFDINLGYSHPQKNIEK